MNTQQGKWQRERQKEDNRSLLRITFLNKWKQYESKRGKDSSKYVLKNCCNGLESSFSNRFCSYEK